MRDIAHLKGSIPPLLTPFRDGAVDYATYERLVGFHVANGSHGILVNGTTGEPSTLTIEERNRLVDLAVKTAARRVPVVAATGSQSFADTQALTSHAVRAGVDALLILTPYFIRPPQRGLVRYFLELANEHETPWMIYHIPGRAAVDVKLETLQSIAAESRYFVGMKHASTDLALVAEALEVFGPEFKIFVGLEELSFPMMAMGACGLMNAVGNLCPGLLAKLCEAVWANDLGGARAMHQRLRELNAAVFFDTNPIPIKYMAKRMGIIPANEHRLPNVPATPELERRLDEVLKRAELL